MAAKEIKTCAHCEGNLSTCSCAWKGTTDKKLVHMHCYTEYEAKLKNQPITCGFCEKVFTTDPYFKTQDGKFAHFACQHKYEQKLINKK